MTEPTQILFDRLRYMDKLTGAGIPEPQARAHADAMDNALRESVATKSDIARLDAKIDIAVRDLTIRTGGMLVVLFGALAAIKFFG
jgi:hypothetical protein